MKEPYGEGLASHTGPESCAGVREGAGEALTGAPAGRVLSHEIPQHPGADAVHAVRKATPVVSNLSQRRQDPARSKTPCMLGNSWRRNWEIPPLTPTGVGVRTVNLQRARRR